MGFDFFSQPQGPAINISLFPDSANAGISAGKNLPTTTTSIIQGVTQGVKTSQELIQNQQQIEIQQNQIDQIPVQNAINQQKLTSAELQNETEQLKLKVIKSDEEAFLRAERAKMEAQALSAEQTLQDLKNQDSIGALLDSNDAATRKQILFDPKFKGTLIRNPKLLESVTGQLAARGDLTEEEKKRAYEAINFSQTMQNQQQLDVVNARYRDTVKNGEKKLFEDIAKDGQIAGIMAKTGIKDLGELARDVTTEYDSMNPGYKVLYKGAEIPGLGATYRLDEGSNKLLMGLQHSLQADNLIPANKPAAPVATPDAAKSAKPYSDALRTEALPADAAQTPKPTNENIVEQRKQELIRNPSTRDKLVQKNLFREPVVPPVPSTTPTSAKSTPTPFAEQTVTPITTPQFQGEATPQAVVPQTESAPVPAQPANIPMTTGTDRGAAVPQGTPEPKPLTVPQIKQVIDYEVPGSERTVASPEPEKIRNVLRDPLLRGLDPFHKAFVALESGGIATAKNKNSSAEGYFQLTTAAAKDVKKDKSKPKENVEGGVDYVNRLMARYGNNKVATAFAYHVGMGTVDSAINFSNSMDYDDLMMSFRYLKDRGMYTRELADLENVAIYPRLVLSYERVFNAIASRKLTVR